MQAGPDRGRFSGQKHGELKKQDLLGGPVFCDKMGFLSVCRRRSRLCQSRRHGFRRGCRHRNHRRGCRRRNHRRACCRRRDGCWGEERWDESCRVWAHRAGGRRRGGYWVAAHRVRQMGEYRRRVCIRRRDGGRRPWEEAVGAGVHGADGGGEAVPRRWDST